MKKSHPKCFDFCLVLGMVGHKCISTLLAYCISLLGTSHIPLFPLLHAPRNLRAATEIGADEVQINFTYTFFKIKTGLMHMKQVQIHLEDDWDLMEMEKENHSIWNKISERNPSDHWTPELFGTQGQPVFII